MGKMEKKNRKLKQKLDILKIRYDDLSQSYSRTCDEYNAFKLNIAEHIIKLKDNFDKKLSGSLMSEVEFKIKMHELYDDIKYLEAYAVDECNDTELETLIEVIKTKVQEMRLQNKNYYKNKKHCDYYKLLKYDVLSFNNNKSLNKGALDDRYALFCDGYGVYCMPIDEFLDQFEKCEEE